MWDEFCVHPGSLPGYAGEGGGFCGRDTEIVSWEVSTDLSLWLRAGLHTAH